MTFNTSKLFQTISIIVFVVLLQSCETQQLEITNISAHEKDGNVLRIEVLFEITQDAMVEITYWSDQDTVRLRDSKKAGENNFILIGLEPEEKYSFVLSTKNSNKEVETELGVFKTNKLPDDFPVFDLVIDSGNVFAGYLLLRYTKKPARQIIINNKAHVVWYQDFDTTIFRPSTFTKEQTLLSIENTKLIKEYDLYGNILFELHKGEKGFDKLIHHEIIKNKNNYLALTREKQVFDLSEIGGGKADTVKSDGILVLDDDGNKVWEWSIFDVENPVADKNILKMIGDWGHANSLSIDENGNYLISFRLFDQVWNIDAITGEVLWKLGLNGDFDMAENDYFFKQHAAHINADGDLMLFDNGNIFNPISRSLSFNIDNENRKLSLKTKVILPDSLHTFKMGSAYLIPENKFLICASTKQKVLVTNNKSDILWMLDCNRITYRTQYIKALYLN